MLLKQMLEDHNIIVVIGLPGAGKTSLTAGLGTHVIHTDDYLWMPSEDVLEALLEDIIHVGWCVVEGTLGYRLLRYGLRNGWEPDAVLHIHREARPSNRMDKALTTILETYLYMDPSVPMYWHMV